MRFLLLLLLLCSPAFGEIQLDGGTPNEVLAVQALIEHFADTEVIIRTDPWYTSLPVFVVYAEAAASFGDCAVNPLIEALMDGNSQVCVAAAIALEAVGPAAIKAKPLLEEMLQSEDDRTNILACGIIRGIGPNAVELINSVMVCLDSENFHVQYWACRALGGIGPNATQAIDRLCELLKDGVASVRRNAALALGEIAIGLDDPTVIQALEQATEDYSHLVRVAAQEALITIENFQKNPC